MHSIKNGKPYQNTLWSHKYLTDLLQIKRVHFTTNEALLFISG